MSASIGLDARRSAPIPERAGAIERLCGGGGTGPGAGNRVNIRVPKDAQSQVNQTLQDKGIDFNLSVLKPEDLEELVANLDDLTVDVENKQKVWIYSE